MSELADWSDAEERVEAVWVLDELEMSETDEFDSVLVLDEVSLDSLTVLVLDVDDRVLLVLKLREELL